MPSVLDYALMASAAYDESPAVPRWMNAGTHYDPASGLRTAVFTNGPTYVVSFRGTVTAGDWVTDAQLTVGMNTAMYPQGEAIAQRNSHLGNVVLTGHSLGGAVAQTVGNRLGLPFVTFNAPGVALLASRNIWTGNPQAIGGRMLGGTISALTSPSQAWRDAMSAFSVTTGRNYRLNSDIVSATGVHYGTIITLPAGTANPATAHGIATMIGVLETVTNGAFSYP